jgi:hypothetical protein
MKTEEYIERIVHHNVPLDDGRVVALFVNRDSGLVVLDIVDADDKGGVEVYRAHAKPFVRNHRALKIKPQYIGAHDSPVTRMLRKAPQS